MYVFDFRFQWSGVVWFWLIDWLVDLEKSTSVSSVANLRLLFDEDGIFPSAADSSKSALSWPVLQSVPCETYGNLLRNYNKPESVPVEKTFWCVVLVILLWRTMVPYGLQISSESRCFKRRRRQSSAMYDNIFCIEE